MSQAAQAHSPTGDGGHVRNNTNAPQLAGIWQKACDLDDLLGDLEGAASAATGLALWIQENGQSLPDYVTTGLLHVAEDVVDHHLPAIWQWSSELSDLVRHRLPDDPLVALESQLCAAERDYGNWISVADRAPAEDQAQMAARADEASARIADLVNEIASTPIRSTQGVAVAVRCLVFLNELGRDDVHAALARGILGWAGERTGLSEARQGIALRWQRSGADA